MTIHDFDILRFISNEEVEELNVNAGNFVSNFGDKDIDTAMIHLKLKSGAFALIENCRVTTYGYDQRVEVFGTESNIKFENIFVLNLIFLKFKLKKHVKMYHLSKYHPIWPKNKATVAILILFCKVSVLQNTHPSFVNN